MLLMVDRPGLCIHVCGHLFACFLSTVEVKPLALVSVKTEPKEKVVMETKAKPTSAQSTSKSSI